MRRILHEALSALALLIIVFSMITGVITIVKLFTDSQIISSISVVLIMSSALFIIRRFDKKMQRSIRSNYLYTLDEAHIRNVLHDWSRNKITTKQALQNIDSIYQHHYTDNVVIKDGDRS